MSTNEDFATMGLNYFDFPLELVLDRNGYTRDSNV